MYPTISDLLKDLFGINLSLPVQTFGFFIAISFILAAWIVMTELKRKEKLGVISAQKKKVLRGKPASVQELVVMALVGFVLGFKLVEIFLDYSFFAENPQKFLFSSRGSITGGLAGAALAAFFRFREKQKTRLEKPEWVEVEVHPYELTGNIIMFGALFAIIGAKIFHNLENPDDFADDPVDALLSFSGLTFYGGFIMTTAFLLWYANKNKIPPLVMADVGAPAVLIGYAVGRIGCQMAGDGDWGIVNEMAKPEWLGFLPDWFWAYNYPHNVINEGVQIADCTGKHCFQLMPPVFPTPVYETLTCSVFFIVIWIIRNKIKTAGILFAIFLIMNGLERFFIEKIRVNTTYNIFGNKITQAEIISTVLFFAGIILLVLLLKKKKSAEV